MILVAIFLGIIFFIICVLCMIPFLVPWMEPKLLFQPARVPFYDNLSPDRTDARVLPNGGLLFRYYGQRSKFYENENYRPRKILFLHGNAGHIGYFLPAAQMLDDLGYDMYLLEYHGYGVSKNTSVTADGLVRDLYEAWQVCGDSDTILMGFSLGGIVIGQGYSQLVPSPAQIVFLNATGNLPQLAQELAPMGFGKLLTPFMSTKNWITPKPVITPYNQNMSVLIVCTADDRLIPPRHSWQLHQTFQELKPMVSTVPDGGHETGPFANLGQWKIWLLSSMIPSRR